MAKQATRTTKTSETQTTGKPVTSRSGTTRRTSRPSRAKASIQVNEQQIRERAYRVYLARDGRPGNATSDWVQAELELRPPRKR